MERNEEVFQILGLAGVQGVGDTDVRHVFHGGEEFIGVGVNIGNGVDEAADVIGEHIEAAGGSAGSAQGITFLSQFGADAAEAAEPFGRSFTAAFQKFNGSLHFGIGKGGHGNEDGKFHGSAEAQFGEGFQFFEFSGINFGEEEMSGVVEEFIILIVVEEVDVPDLEGFVQGKAAVGAGNFQIGAA